MKLKAIKIIFLGLICSICQNYGYSMDNPSCCITPELDENKIIEETDCKIRVYEGNLYVNLRKKNEADNGVYMLVMISENGDRELIEFKQGHKNTINQFIGYSFIHKNIHQGIVYYELIQVRQETNILKAWNVCDGQVCFDNAPYALAEGTTK